MSSHYSKSFRIRVAREASDPEMKGMEKHIADKYGIREGTVRRWRQIYEEYGENALGRSINAVKKKTDREISLEKENAELREELEILKKAAAFLANVGRE